MGARGRHGAGRDELPRARALDPAGHRGKAVDGDQRLWLRVAPGLTVIVIGLRGEPYLRFSQRGIEVNKRSATYFLNRSRATAPPPRLGAHAPPLWQRLTAGRSTSWHEDRLHALALAAHPPGARSLGRWVVPLLVDGKASSVEGTLRQAPRPSLLWFWPVALALACAPALLRLRSAALDVGVGSALAALALGAATAGRLGRELYGRPDVSAGQVALAGLTAVVAIGLGALWLRRDWRTVAGVAIAIVALYQGLALVGTLRNAFVLAALPAWLERTTASVALAAGIGLLVVIAGAAGPEPALAVDRAPPDEQAEREPE